MPDQARGEGYADSEQQPQSRAPIVEARNQRQSRIEEDFDGERPESSVDAETHDGMVESQPPDQPTRCLVLQKEPMAEEDQQPSGGRPGRRESGQNRRKKGLEEQGDVVCRRNPGESAPGVVGNGPDLPAATNHGQKKHESAQNKEKIDAQTGADQEMQKKSAIERGIGHQPAMENGHHQGRQPAKPVENGNMLRNFLGRDPMVGGCGHGLCRNSQEPAPLSSHKLRGLDVANPKNARG